MGTKMPPVSIDLSAILENEADKLAHPELVKDYISTVKKYEQLKNSQLSNKSERDQSTRVNKSEKPIKDAIVDEIQSLEDGWSGPESIAPSKEVVKEVKKLVQILNIQSKKNLSIWVDDDGTVTFFWLINNDEVLSIDIVGDGKAHCTYTPRNKIPSASGKFNYSDASGLKEFVYSRVN